MNCNRGGRTFDLQLFAIIGGDNGFPAAILNVMVQQNYLETKIRKGIHAALVLRAAAAKKSLSYFDAQIGESKTFTRSNPIAPVSQPSNPADNTGLDNGLTPTSRGFEQWQAVLNKWDDGVNLNVLENEALLGDVYVDNMVELGEAGQNSLEVVCVQRALSAYDTGDTFAVSAATTQATIAVDNIKGFDTQYLGTNAPSYGLPQPVTAQNEMPIIIVDGATGAFKAFANCTSAVADPVNASYMQTGGVAFGISGTLNLDRNVTCVEGDRIVAMDRNTPTGAFNPTFKDGSFVLRPLSSGVMVQDAYNMAVTDTITPSVQIAQAKSILARRRVPKLSNGLYGCIIDSTLLSFFYEDTGFQRATQGTWDRAPVFKDGIIAKGWGVEFVEATQLPVYIAPNGSFPLRHAFVFGEDVVSEHPFAGARNAVSRPAQLHSIYDIRWSDLLEFITQAPIDREAEVVKMTYKYVGDFQPGTDKGSTPNVVFTSDWCRYKRGVIIQAASPI